MINKFTTNYKQGLKKLMKQTKAIKISYIINNKHYYILYLSKSNLNNIDLKSLTR